MIPTDSQTSSPSAHCLYMLHLVLCVHISMVVAQDLNDFGVQPEGGHVQRSGTSLEMNTVSYRKL